MYADASSFVLTLHVYPDGAVVATSSDEARLKACRDHLLKPHGFKFVQEGRSYTSGRYEHPNGGQRVVEQIRAVSVKDGFTLIVEDKRGKELRKKTLADILGDDDLLEDPDVTPACSAAPLSPARAPPASGSECPPTQSRKTPASSELAEGSTPEKRARGDERAGFRPRALTASFDQSANSSAAPASGPGSSSAPAPAIATAADDGWFASEDALCAAVDASTGGAASSSSSSTRPQASAEAPAPAIAAAGSDFCLPDDDLCAAMEAHEAAMAAAAMAPPPPAAPPASSAAAAAAAPQPPASPGLGLARAPGKPACRFGLACFRRNPAHWSGFDHPDGHPFLRECKKSSEVEPTVID